jgi:hypothetical protein
MLNVVMLNVIMLNVIMPSVIMLNVVAPGNHLPKQTLCQNNIWSRSFFFKHVDKLSVGEMFFDRESRNQLYLILQFAIIDSSAIS